MILSPIFGIDPGLSGAVAELDPQLPQIATVRDMPIAPYGKAGFVKNAVDLVELARLLGRRVDAWVFLERVSAFPGQGVGSMFSLGMSYWGAAGVAHALEHEVVLVEPKAWKGHFGLSKDKAEALALARKLFPTCPDLARAKDHGRAEALLIARYGLDRLLAAR